MAVKIDNESTTGRPSYTLPASDTAEKTVFTSAESRPRWFSCFLDLTNLLLNCTVRLQVRIDGTNYRNLDTNDGRNPYAFTVASDDDGVMLGPILVADRVQVTIQSSGAGEVAGRAIPHHVVEVPVY